VGINIVIRYSECGSETKRNRRNRKLWRKLESMRFHLQANNDIFACYVCTLAGDAQNVSALCVHRRQYFDVKLNW